MTRANIVATHKSWTGAIIWRALLAGVLIGTSWAASIAAAERGKAADPTPDPAPELSPVNVLLILADDVGVDQVACYESGYHEDDPTHPTPCTPVLDSLAANGVRFTNAWSNPVCSPTRTQILTGMPACFSGMGGVTNPTKPQKVGLDPDFCTIADLAPASAAAGKWHLADETQGIDHPLEIGFDAFLGPMYNLTQFPQDGPEFTNWRQWNGLSCEPELMTQYATARTVDDAIDFIDGFGTEPWLLYVPFNASHAPFHCPPADSCSSGCGTNDWCADCDTTDTASMTRAMTQALDYNIGRLLDEIDFATTAVIFLGDNGTPKAASFSPFFSDHAKGTVYQGGVNVPLIIRTPNQVAPTTCNALVSATDLFQTVSELLQPTAPCSNSLADSYSLLRYTDAGYLPTEPERSVVYSESFSPTFRPEPDGSPPPGFLVNAHIRAIRDSTHKLIERNTFSGGAVTTDYEAYRLYDPLVGDPLPHDPAILDDATSPDSLDSAYELKDLLLEVNPQEGLAAKERLLAAMDSLYRRLDVGRVITLPPCIVRSVEYGQFAPPPGGGSTGEDRFAEARTTSYFCEEQYPELGYEGFTSGFRIDRTFLEFNLSSGVSLDPCRKNFPATAQIERVMLDVAVREGGTLASTAVEAWPMTTNIPNGMSESECQTLYEGVDLGSGAYTTLDEWRDDIDFCTPMVKSFDITSAIGDIEDALAGNKLFTVALLRQTESSATDRVRLLASGEDTDNEYALRVYYHVGGTPPGGPGNATIPRTANLSRAYPNPFNPVTTIQYGVPEAAHVTLEIYDAAGRLIRSLVDEPQSPGESYKVIWDGRDHRGKVLPSGVYYSRLQVGAAQATGEMILIR